MQNMTQPNLDIVLAVPPSIEPHSPPLGLALLKATLGGQGFQSKCVDLNTELLQKLDRNLDYFIHKKIHKFIDREAFNDFYQETLSPIFDEWAQRLVAYQADWIGFTVHDRRNELVLKKLCALIKEIKPTQKIVLGGPQSEIFGPKAFEQNLVDAWIVGEAERAIIALLEGDLKFPGINGTPRVARSESLDNLPIPDFSDFDLSAYPSEPFKKNSHEFGLKRVFIEGSRGCTRRCSFCDITSYWGKFSRKSPARIFLEMKEIFQTTGIREFVFTDSLVNGNLSDFSNLCSLVADYNLNNPEHRFTWRGHYIIHGNKIHPPEYFDVLRDSGCSALKVGVESGSEDLRKQMKKNFSNDDLLRSMEQFVRVGIKVRLLFFVGYPTETDHDFEQTLDLINKLNEYKEAIHCISSGVTLQILKNAPLSEEAKKLGVKFYKNETPYFTTIWSYKDNDLNLRLNRHERLCSLINNLGLPIEDYLENHIDNLRQHLKEVSPMDEFQTVEFR